MEKVISRTGSIPVMEHFYTIQGEGYHQGRPAYFIRLAGCDVGCHWCDVKESWEIGKDQLVSIDSLVKQVKQSNTTFVVVTGGEPFIHDVEELYEILASANLELAVETSGAYPLSGKWHWICLSPKKFKAPLPQFYPLANELKVIIFNKSDFDWAEKHAALVNEECNLYLQAEWSKRKEIYPLLVAYAKTHPKWKISVQSHKYLDIP